MNEIEEVEDGIMNRSEKEEICEERFFYMKNKKHIEWVKESFKIFGIRYKNFSEHISNLNDEQFNLWYGKFIMKFGE